MKGKVYTVLGFDMETDIGSWSPYYEGLKKGTPRIMDLLDKEGIPATFYFTGEAAEKHPEICREVYHNGFEIGCHSLSHETLGDALFDIPGVFKLLPEEVEGRIKKATAIVKGIIKETPTSFRCPRLWGSTATVNALENLGYISDASYPMYFYGKQIVPYHPSRENWLEKGEMKIVEIPNFADITMHSNDPYNRDRDQWPLFRTESALALMVHIDNFIEHLHQNGLPAVVCFYFHPWEFIEMPSKVRFGEGTVIPDEFIVKNCGDYALAQLKELISILKKKGSTFMSARDIAQEFDWK